MQGEAMRTRTTGAALSRRRALYGAVVAGAGAFIAACGGNKKDEGTSAGVATAAAGAATAVAETPKSGGMLREADITQAPHFSPFHPGADPSFVNYWRRLNGYYDS